MLRRTILPDGMTDELITDLAQIKALRVVSRTSVMMYKGTRKPLSEIARELNVDAVVEGSVLRSGDQVRINSTIDPGARPTDTFGRIVIREAFATRWPSRIV